MGNIEGAITRSRSETVAKSALAAKKVHEKFIRAATGGDMKLSGVGVTPQGKGKGAKVGVRFDLKGGSWDPEALLKATGPMHFVENPMGPHRITSRRMSGSRASRNAFGPHAGGMHRRKRHQESSQAMTDTVAETTEAVAPGEWVITWRGRVWHESDLTGKHLSVLSLIAGRDDFDTLEMDPRLGHQRLMMLIAALRCVEEAKATDAEDPDDVAALMAQCIEEVSEASVEEILGALTVE